MSFNNQHNNYFVKYNSPKVNGSTVFPVKHVNQYYDLNYVPIFGVNTPYVTYTSSGVPIVHHKVKPYPYVKQSQYYKVSKPHVISVSSQQPYHIVHHNPPNQYIQQPKPYNQYIPQQHYQPQNNIPQQSIPSQNNIPQQKIPSQNNIPQQPSDQYINQQQINQPPSSKSQDKQFNQVNDHSVISDEQYLKQVEELKKKFGFEDSQIQQSDSEIIDIESMQMNEEFMLLQQLEFEEYVRNFDNPLLNEIFETTKNVVNASKRYPRIGWPIWELSLFSDEKRNFNIQSSFGIESKVDNEIIEDDWILIDENQSFTNQKNVVIDRKSGNEYKNLELSLLSDEPDVQSISTIVKNHGIRNDLRAFTWQLLLGYLEPSVWKRAETLDKKRREYYQLLENKLNKTMTKSELKNLNCILLDSPRTRSDLFPNIIKLTCVKRSLERVLFIWSSVYNSIGYFQGLNEIASVLYLVFIETALAGFHDIDNTFDNDNCVNIKFMEEILINIEADVYFCLDLLIQYIGNVYPLKTGLLFTQPVSEEAESVIKQENPLLWKHITDRGISFNIFLFRWVLCLFVRELSTSSSVCLIDSYIAEGEQGLAKQHVYTVAAFLLLHSNNLLNIHDEETLMGYLLRMPTSNYINKDVLKIVKEANRLKKRYYNKVVTKVIM